VPEDDLTPTQHRNLEALTAWVAAYNAQDGENLAKVVTEGFRLVDPATGTDIVGRDSFGEIDAVALLNLGDHRLKGVCPPCPMAISRAAWLTGVPK